MATQTPILCPQCLAQVAIVENLPPNDDAVMIACTHCGLGQIVNTNPIPLT